MSIVAREQSVTTTRVKSVMVCDNPECAAESDPYDHPFEAAPLGWMLVIEGTEGVDLEARTTYCSKSCLFDAIQP